MKHANKVALDIKLLRSSIAQRDKERAERATLVAQEKLVSSRAVCRSLVTVCVCVVCWYVCARIVGNSAVHSRPECVNDVGARGTHVSLYCTIGHATRLRSARD